VAWFDVDGLKLRNDSAGHGAGDQLIKAAAQALTRASRRGHDEVFRLHTKGDEFLVLLHGPLDSTRVARVFLDVLRRHGVRASGGFAYSTETRYLPARTELRTLAEVRCRQAKARGGDCVIAIDNGKELQQSCAGLQRLPAGPDPSEASADCRFPETGAESTPPADAPQPDWAPPPARSETPVRSGDRSASQLLVRTVHP
jgi:diguanylate cyclase (GGDEF)-like protein